MTPGEELKAFSNTHAKHIGLSVFAILIAFVVLFSLHKTFNKL